MNEDRSTGLWLQDTAVIIEGEQSAYVPVEYGVPQVLILGPSLFLYFLNDI